jgi:hypothetical protein
LQFEIEIGRKNQSVDAAGIPVCAGGCKSGGIATGGTDEAETHLGFIFCFFDLFIFILLARGSQQVEFTKKDVTKKEVHAEN